MSKSRDEESVFSRRQRIYTQVRSGHMGQELLDDLLPRGEPHLYEKQLWDYKLELPALPVNRRPSDSEKSAYGVTISEVVKDAVSFYNSYGGYLVIGVRDNPRETVGFDTYFDVGELNARISAATRHELDCHYSVFKRSMETSEKSIGLLFIPQRPEHLPPAQFLRDAPISPTGKRAYKKHDIYFRQGDECRTAHSSDDYSFLCSHGRRQFLATHEIEVTPALSNNLGPRDPGFIRFIGREDYLQDLWRWLFDKYTPCKLLSGLGGVGKTTIARVFAEEIIRNAPLGFEAVIWLSAKAQLYVAILGAYKPTSRLDFTDADSLLRTLLLELGSTEEMLDPEWTTEELIEQAVKTLCVIPAFVVVDDIDSLEPEHQQTVFHSLLQVMGQTAGKKCIPSRALLTARLDLGAAPSQIIRVLGLSKKDFSDFVEMTAKILELPWGYRGGSKIMDKFYRVTDGSPTFAASILRLLGTGMSLDVALRDWKGSQGEEVREFAFKKELENLTESQARTLYAAIMLGETSFVELQNITRSSKTLLSDDISELRKYHLAALGDQIPEGGARLVIPSGIRLMANLVKKHVRDPKRIERECASSRAVSPKLSLDVGRVVHRVMGLSKDLKLEEALQAAIFAVKQNPQNADLRCLLGRCYLNQDPPQPKDADKEFRKANEYGCYRSELFSMWIQAKVLMEDWGGILEITRLADPRLPSADNLVFRATAYNELGNVASLTKNQLAAASHYLNGAREIYQALSEGLGGARRHDLIQLRNLLLENYVDAIDRATPDPHEHIRVWLAIGDAFRCGLRERPTVRLGLRKLGSWWNAVESRERYDAKAVNLINAQLRMLEVMANTISREGCHDEDFVSELRMTWRTLENRIASYSGSPR